MYERGKLVLVPFPFTDLSQAKVRPAVIVSDLKYCREDVSVIFVSSKAALAQDKTDHIIKSSSKHFHQTGLKVDSVIKCHKIATLDRKIVLGEIGSLHQRDQNAVDRKLKMALGL